MFSVIVYGKGEIAVKYLMTAPLTVQAFPSSALPCPKPRKLTRNSSLSSLQKQLNTFHSGLAVSTHYIVSSSSGSS